jgi:hypothetical protein
MCGDTLRKGSWEIFTHCPSCGQEWPVDPDEPQRVKRRIVRNAALWTLVSLVPGLGIVGGMVGAFWGYLAVKIKHPVLGTTAMIIGIVVGAMGQSLVAWWAVGERDQGRCQKELTTLAGSIRAYAQQTRHYPPSLADLKRLDLPAPTECPGGGGAYFYLAPVISPPASGGGLTPTTSPGNARTLMVAEVIQGHRRFRMCVTTDLEVRAVGQNAFDKLMAEPRNAAFARKFWRAWAATTQPDKKPAPAKTPGPTAASAPATTAASGPATRRSPADAAATAVGAEK